MDDWKQGYIQGPAATIAEWMASNEYDRTQLFIGGEIQPMERDGIEADGRTEKYKKIATRTDILRLFAVRKEGRELLRDLEKVSKDIIVHYEKKKDAGAVDLPEFALMGLPYLAELPA